LPIGIISYADSECNIPKLEFYNVRKRKIDRCSVDRKKRILYITQKSENPGNYQHKFTNFCNIITSQAYKTGGETIEKKYVFYKPGNIYALYFLRENTLCYNINFSGKTKFIYMIR